MAHLKSIVQTAGLLLLSVLLYADPLHATGQASDKLIFKGAQYKLNVNPLEGFFKQHPDKRPKGGRIVSSLWRGYVATFWIRNGFLEVADVVILTGYDMEKGDQIQSIHQAIFGKGTIVVADWFDGLLVIPDGEMLEYIHMGYASKYERYLLLQIKKGRLVKERVLEGSEYQKFKERQFEEYKKSPEFEATIKEWEENPFDPTEGRESYERFLFLYETEFASKYVLDF